jgi:hypothetical protein
LSTILDALRKVERETAQQSQQLGSLFDTPLARVLAEKRNRRVFRQMGIVITILFLVGTGVTITLGHKIFSSKGTVSTPSVADTPKKVREAKISTVPISQREQAREPASVVKKPAPEPERMVKKEERIPLPSRDETALPVLAKPLQESAPQVSIKPAAAIETGMSEAPIPDLELQAIVWSEDPKNCSAMINGRLVRSRDQVGGFTVDEIGRNYVSVRSGLRSGKLRMIGAR